MKKIFEESVEAGIFHSVVVFSQFRGEYTVEREISRLRAPSRPTTTRI
jgi:hypothetical protein